jgi:hypothetical protein
MPAYTPIIIKSNIQNEIAKQKEELIKTIIKKRILTQFYNNPTKVSKFEKKPKELHALKIVTKNKFENSSV